jgi:hypothetical protein
VSSDSGAYDCGAGKTCEIDIVDLFFAETFTALPAEGQLFLGWKKQPWGLCRGKTTPCELVSAPLEGFAILEQFLQSDQRFYLEPVFAPVGGSSFNVRYCEVLIGRPSGGAVEAEVWGTQSLNDCPESNVRALDVAAIAADNEALWARINGPRYWVLDELQVVSLPPGFRALEDIRQDFGGIEMRLITSVRIPQSEADSANGEGYQVAEVARDTVFTFVAGRRVYELQDPSDRRYLMQSFSQAVDEDLHITELADLGGRLQLPEGWRFRSYILAEEFRLPSVDGVAKVVTDNLANTYQLVPE